MSDNKERKPRRTSSGVQPKSTTATPRVAAVICVNAADEELVALVDQRIGASAEVVLARDELELNEARATIMAASMFALAVRAPIDPGEAVGHVSQTWPCVRPLWFGRYVAPRMPPSPGPHLRNVEIWATPYFDDVSKHADELVMRVEQGLAWRLRQIAAARAYARKFDLNEDATKLMEAIALRLPEHTWWKHAGLDHSKKMRRFLKRSVYDKIGYNSRVELSTQVLDFEQRWLAENPISSRSTWSG